MSAEEFHSDHDELAFSAILGVLCGEMNAPWAAWLEILRGLVHKSVEMPYNHSLAERIRGQLVRRKRIEERTMFGCIVFLLNGNACVGVWKDSLVARVGPKQYPEALKESFVNEFDITGRAMTGWVTVGPEGVEDDDQLQEWTDRALTFVRTLPAK